LSYYLFDPQEQLRGLDRKPKRFTVPDLSHPWFHRCVLWHDLLAGSLKAQIGPEASLNSSAPVWEPKTQSWRCTSDSPNGQILLGTDTAIGLPTDRTRGATVLIQYLYTNNSNINTGMFGTTTGDRFGAHVPWNNQAYFDWRTTGAGDRINGIHATSTFNNSFVIWGWRTKDDFQDIWRNGVSVDEETDSGTTDRTNNNNPFEIFAHNNLQAPAGHKCRFIRVWDTFIPDAQMREMSANPWRVYERPLPIWIQSAAGATTVTKTADLDFLAKEQDNLLTATLDLLAKKLDNLKTADLDLLAKTVDNLKTADEDFLAKTLNNLKTADLDLLAKVLDNLKTADLDFIVTGAGTNTLEADLDLLAKVLDNLKTADLDFIAKSVDNLETADLDFLAKKVEVLEATLDIIVTSGTVLKTATLDMLIKKLDNVKQIDIDFVVVGELLIALCARVVQITNILSGTTSTDNYFSGVTSNNGLLTASIDVSTVCN
jgi:hypothetical protein